MQTFDPDQISKSAGLKTFDPEALGKPGVIEHERSLFQEIKQDTGDFADDIIAPIKDPSQIAGRMRAGVSSALAGIQEMRANETERQGELSLYASGEIRQDAQRLRQESKDIKAGLYQPKTQVGEFAASLTESLPAALAGVAAAIVGGPGVGFAVGAGLGSSQVYGQKYDERIQMGDAPEDANSAALIHGVAEIGSEALGVSAFAKLLKAAKSGGKISSALAKDAFVEGAEEIVAGLIQGTEDAWRGAGKDPAGLAGALEYYKSGQFAQDALLNFAGGALLGGALDLAVMKPIQMSYRPTAVQIATDLNSTIAEAQAQGAAAVQVGERTVPVEELQEKLSNIVEGFDLTESDYGVSAIDVERQSQLDNAKSVIESFIGEEPAPSAVEEIPVPAESVLAPEPLAIDPTVDVAETLNNTTDLRIHTSQRVSKRVSSIIGEIQKEIGTKASILMIDRSDIDLPEYDAIREATLNPLSLDNLSMGRLFRSRNQETGKIIYTVVGELSNEKDLSSYQVGMHEVSGHITYYEHIDNAPAMIKEAIDRDFASWKTSGKKAEGFFPPSFFEKSFDAAKNLQANIQQREEETPEQYETRLFKEYSAQRLVASMEKRPEVRSIIERYWAKLGAKLQSLFKRFKDSYGDIYTSTESFDQFVDWLFTGRVPQSVEGDLVNIENLNTNLKGSVRPLVDVIFDSIFEVVDGKRVIKNAWRAKRVYKDGKIGTLTRGAVKNSPYSYKELDGKTVVLHGKIVMFTIPWDASRNLSQKSARMIATNIRDMFILSTLNLSPVSKSREKSKLILNQLGGGRKAATPKQAEMVEQLYKAAEALAEVEGVSVKQALLLLTSGYNTEKPGVAGTPVMSRNQMNRTVEPFIKDIERFRDAYPNLFSQLYPAIEGMDLRQLPESAQDDGVIEGEMALTSESNQADTVIETPSNAQTWYSELEDSVGNAVDKAIDARKTGSFEEFTEAVIFYLDVDGKDYTEISREFRNVVHGLIKSEWASLSGVEIQEEIKNKVVMQDKVVEMHKMGMDTTLDEIELMHMARDMGLLSTDDLIGLYDRIRERLGEDKILGSFVDRVDGFKKAYFSDKELSWKGSQPHSGAILSGLIKRKNAAGTLVIQDLISHPDLFKAYPELIDLKVKLFNDPSKGAEGGTSSWPGRYITLNIAKPAERVTDALVHELQHQVQGIEDFAGGADPDFMQKMKDDRVQALHDSRDLLLTAKSIADAASSMSVDESEVLARRLKRAVGRELEILEGIRLRLQNKDFGDALYEFENEYLMAREAALKVKGLSGPEIYWYTAGEVESRKVEALRKTGLDNKTIKEIFEKEGDQAFADVSPDMPRYKVSARSNEVFFNVTRMIDDSFADELSLASYQMLSVDNLKSVPKKRKAARRKDIKTGPYANELRELPPPRKIRKARKTDPAKLEQKRKQVAEFLASMDSYRDEGLRVNKSISEIMEDKGIDKAIVKKAVSRYNRLRSNFTDTEIIYRLAEIAGLINEDTGTEGLEGVIRTMFPDKTVEEVQEDGSVKTVVYPGSDGTVQSLSSVGKDKLINQLQTIIAGIKGNRVDIESFETLAQLKDRNVEEFTNLSAYRKVIELIKSGIASASDFLSETAAGRKLQARLRRYMLLRTIMQRDYLVRLNKFAQEYKSDAERLLLYQMHIGEVQPRNERDRAFLSLLRAVNRTFGKEMQLLQVKVFKRDGSYTYFNYNRDMSDVYYPRMWDPKDLRNPTEEMVQSLIRSGEAGSVSEAKALLREYRLQRVKADKFANVEMARETNLDGFIKDPIEAYTRYIQKASSRLALLREFGSTPEVALSQAMIRHVKESRDPASLRKTRDFINAVTGAAYEDGIIDQATKWGVGKAAFFSIGLLLQHSFIIQPSVMFNVGGIAGYKNLVKGIAKVLPSLWGNKDGIANKRWAELAGVLAFTVNRELNDIIMEDKTRAGIDRTLRTFGITQVDAAMRIVTAIVGKLYTVDLANKWALTGDLKAKARLERLGLDPNQITADYIASSTFLSRDLRLAALAFTEDTNHVLNAFNAPAMLKGTGWMRILFLFKNFAFQQHRLILRLMRENKGDAFKVLLGSLTGGTFIAALRMLMQGDDPEKVLEEDGIPRFLWKGLMAGGGAGLFAEAIGNAAGLGGPTTAGDISIDTPMFGILETLGRGSKSTWDYINGEETEQDLHNMYKASVMSLQAGLLQSGKGIPIAAAIGMARPMSERFIAPSNRQQKTSMFQ